MLPLPILLSPSNHRAMKKYLTILGLLLLFMRPAEAQKMYSCNNSYDADFKVYVVDNRYDADLLVYKVNNRYNTSNDGLWYFVENRYDADKKIFFAGNRYSADLLIFFVQNRYDAGWKNKSKMHLIY